MDDLEGEIRNALRERASRRSPTRSYVDFSTHAANRPMRRRWSRLGPAIAVVVIALIAVGIASVTWPHSTNSSPSGADAWTRNLSSLVGTTWQVTGARDHGRAAVAVPQNVKILFAFERSGGLIVSDAGNARRTPYQFAPNGQVILENPSDNFVGTAASGASANDQKLVTIGDAIFAMLIDNDHPTRHAVAGRLSSDELQLSAHGYTLILGHRVMNAPTWPCAGTKICSA